MTNSVLTLQYIFLKPTYLSILMLKGCYIMTHKLLTHFFTKLQSVRLGNVMVLTQQTLMVSFCPKTTNVKTNEETK